MKILLLGKGGQVGWELQRSLAPLGTLVAHDFDTADFTQPEQVAALVASVAPDVIVNAAAHTAVDKAESEPEVARLINAATPALVAQEAAKLGALLVHYSTDYVFDGSGHEPRDELAATAPLSVYGTTKLEAEQAIAASGCKHLIFRTSWAKPELGGLYHFVAGGQTTWFDYAKYVIEWARAQGVAIQVAPEAISAVPTTEYPTPAKRPLNSRLDTRKLQHAFGLSLPHWQAGVERMLTEHLGK
jgi:dTDP-4-dehydrorhamnose reductase